MMRANQTEGMPKVEQVLTNLFGAGDPDPAFVMRLEQRLRSQVAQAAGSPAQTSAEGLGWCIFLPRQGWAFAALAIVLALVATVTAIGPGRVLADVQRLLRYVPGVGFTDLDQTLVLKAPAEVTRDGVTVRVEQAIAGRERTQIVLGSEGLPSNNWSGGVTGGGGDTDIGIVLRLPNGKALHPDQWAYRYGGAMLQFPALPPGVTQATLEVVSLPLVTPGSVPEIWHLPLSLQLATDQMDAGRFTQPYSPAGANDRHAGITLRVLEVAHSSAETAVRVQVAWTEPQAKIWHLMGGRTLPVLRDGLGHVYHEKMPSSTGAQAGTMARALPSGAPPIPEEAGGTLEQTLTFEPVSSQARRLTLEVDGIGVEVPVEAEFGLDLGAHPAVGGSWVLDVPLQVAGFKIHLTGARLVEEELRLRDGVIKQTNLEFDVDPVADQSGRTLRGFTLSADSPSFNGSGGGYNFETNRIRVNIQLRESVQAPSGPLTVIVTRASIVETGPWQISWEIPEQ